ncbi:hypothetical protein Btru_017943 [Bulinus truncatus]|nr:hypothetical protein Btru_017943 [Bulinus truncatus]
MLTLLLIETCDRLPRLLLPEEVDVFGNTSSSSTSLSFVNLFFCNIGQQKCVTNSKFESLTYELKHQGLQVCSFTNMSESKVYCEHCDVIFQTKNDYQSHCQGKKHKLNEQTAQRLEAAKRTVFVKGFDGRNSNCKQWLHSYFSHFGTVKQVTLNNRYAGDSANIEFQDLNAALKCLSMKFYPFERRSLTVRQYVYHPPKSEQMRMIHKQNEREEKQKKQTTYLHVMDLLTSARDVFDQIDKITENLKLTTDDEKVRASICDGLTKLFSKYFENCSVHQFGSSINRFGTKGCDLDLFLYFSNEKAAVTKPRVQLPYHKDIKTLKVDYGPLTAEQLKKIDVFDQVKLLAKIMSSRKTEYTDLVTIPSHRCPVIKFVHCSSGIKCDLSLNNRKALYNSLLLRFYGSESRVQKLVSAVRLWAKSHEIAGVGKGQVLTSYALTLLVLFYVMKKEPRIIPLVCDVDKCVSGTHRELVEYWECIVLSADAVLPASENTETVVDLLKGFFQFYTQKINWDTDALILWNNTIVSRADVSQDPFYITSKGGCMMLFDPYVLTHNVLGNVNESTRAKLIQEMKRAAEITSTWQSSGDIQPSSGPWGLAALLACDSENQTKKPETGVTHQTSTKKGHDHHTTKIEGEQDNGDFCIPIQPKPDIKSNQVLQSLAVKNHSSLSLQWCSLAHTMILHILKQVFFTQVTSIEETCIGAVSESYSSERNAKSPIGFSSCKRTSDEARLDQSPSGSSALLPSECNNEFSIENPMKRFCDGIGNTDINAEQHMPSESMESDVCPVNSDNCHSASELLPHSCSENNPNQPFNAGEPPHSENIIYSYSCKCKHKLWMGRSKLKKTRLSKCSLDGLKLELEISKLLFQEMEKLLNQIQLCLTSHQDSTQTSPPITPSHPEAQQKTTSAVRDPNEQDVEFTCSIQYMKTDSSLPFILIRLRPSSSCLNNFKNFYCSFRSIATRLVVSHLFDNSLVDMS